MKQTNFVNMDIQAEKIDLIQWLTQVNDVKLIEKLKQFVQSQDKDFWNELTVEEQLEIKQGIDELNSDNKFAYEDVIASHRK